MRKLHFNIRNYQEPFILIQTELNPNNSLINGIDNYKIKKKILMFGSIMNRENTLNSNFYNSQTSYLSIKIIDQVIKIKPQDRVIYNDNIYVIFETNRDYYNKSEIVIKCNFEKEYIKPPISKLNFLLNSKLSH